MKTLDNSLQIRNLMKFKKEGDFYYIRLYRRGHDIGVTREQKNEETFAKYNRRIGEYFVHSLEEFDTVMDEIRKQCEIHKCRAGINMNRKNIYELSNDFLDFAKKKLEKDKAKKYPHFIAGDYCIQYKSLESKIWYLDVDDAETEGSFFQFKEIISKCDPYDKDFIHKIPSPNGFHVLTSRFNEEKFKKYRPNMRVFKNQVTNLYRVYDFEK